MLWSITLYTSNLAMIVLVAMCAECKFPTIFVCKAHFNIYTENALYKSNIYVQLAGLQLPFGSAGV